MNFDEYQQNSRKTALDLGPGLALIYPTLGLASEAGEVADKVKKMLRDEAGVLSDERRAKIGDELGDVLWYVAAVAHALNLSLEAIAQANLAKLKSRQKRDQIHGTGDER